MPRVPVWAAVAGALFAGSVAALLATAFAAADLTSAELRARDDLRAAASMLATALPAEVAAVEPPPAPGQAISNADNLRLAEKVAAALAAHPGTEGGVYLNGTADQFAGHAHPPARPGKRRDPPPLETDAIRSLARAALARTDPDPAVEVRDVGPSRVALAAAPVGAARPAKAAVWVMTRLSDPAQLQRTLGRYRFAAGLSAAGIVAAAGLAARLGRQLRRSREEQTRLRDGLRRAESLATLGRMLAGVAHEVRNPLAAIRSTVQLWERLPAQARTPESLAAVVTAVDRLNGLVGRLLLFAKSGHEPRVPTDLNALVRETFELVRAQAAGQSVALVADLAPGLPPVAAAPQGFRQVLMNLTANALRAMPDGGTLTVRTLAVASGVELVVVDTGPGVPEADRPRLFEPFFTTRPDGTGLGLALCREIVEQHAGSVAYDSTEGAGAAFRVVLPTTPAPPPLP